MLVGFVLSAKDTNKQTGHLQGHLTTAADKHVASACVQQVPVF